MPSTRYDIIGVDKITGLMDKIAGKDRKIRSGFTQLRGVVNRAKTPVGGLSLKFLQAGNSANKLFSNANQGVTSLTRKLGPLGTGIAAAFAGRSVMNFGRTVLDTLSIFEKYEAVLSNTLGSDAGAKIVLADLAKFSAKNGLQVEQTTGAWVKLANQGFKPNMKQMTSLGDLAASTGKTFDQLAEAALDAQVAEFERLKEFGIRAKSEGDKVKFTFKEVTTEVDNNASSIQKYLLGLGNMEGVSGAMEKISKTTGGMIKMLLGKWTLFKKITGEAFKPLITVGISVLNKLIDKMTVAVNWIKENQAQVTVWTRRVVILGGAFISLFAVAKVILGIGAAVKVITTVFSIFKGVLVVARFAMIAFNVVASMNPLGWIGLAITGILLFIMNFKKVRIFLWKLAKFLWKFHPFSWLIEITDKIFPGFKRKLIDGFKQIITWLSEKIFKPIKNFFSWLWGSADDNEINVKTNIEDPDIDPYANPDGKSFGSGGGGSGGTTGSGVKDKINTIGGVSSNIKNITINIETLVKSINYKSEKIGLTASEVKAEISRILMGVVNDVNYN